MSHQSHGPMGVCRWIAAFKGCGMACQNSGAVWTNCPINAGSRGLEENTGASVVSPAWAPEAARCPICERPLYAQLPHQLEDVVILHTNSSLKACDWLEAQLFQDLDDSV